MGGFPLRRSEDQEDVLETPILLLIATSYYEDKVNHKTICNRSRNVTGLILAAMESGLQQRFEDQDAYTIMKNLIGLFKEQARIERDETLKSILQSKLEKRKSVGPHVFHMIGRCITWDPWVRPSMYRKRRNTTKTTIPPKENTSKVKVVAEHDCLYYKAKGH
ncbi:hypothetical protein KIW84_032011 [Lathyrus oleraceus]|uniref:Uncharacterized protein n=1 Tax=Pisum sativum TaxID=3888 RepID=A0A9D5B147_PEA|nr:hypothetical protein KIW84_032011 [Pisum sativum]